MSDWRELIEPSVARNPITDTLRAQVSAAISLKRIADSMGARNAAMMGSTPALDDAFAAQHPLRPTYGLGEKDALLRDPPDDRWITWAGGECPVGDEALVVVKFRDEETSTSPDAACLFRWAWFDTNSDIIAYRLAGAA